MYERDIKVIEALKKNGSDISKPHSIDFFLDFEKFESAASVAQEMKTEGFEIKMYDNDDGTFTIEAKKTLVPTISNMTEISDKLNSLTEKYGGKYEQ